jgi:hypothetical protein
VSLGLVCFGKDDTDAVDGEASLPSTAAPSGQGQDANTAPVDGDDEPAGTTTTGAKSEPPKKQSVWTQEMKDTFAQLLDNYQEMVELNKRLA